MNNNFKKHLKMPASDKLAFFLVLSQKTGTGILLD
jgi:hypothetical protein